jgi:hypothetical protein
MGLFILTPIPFDGLTALSLSKGSPLKGEEIFKVMLPTERGSL